jgi:hypothetical protein
MRNRIKQKRGLTPRFCFRNILIMTLLNLHRRSITSRQVVKINPFCFRKAFKRGSVIASRSPLRFKPVSDIYLKVGDGLVQCIITIVSPGERWPILSI